MSRTLADHKLVLIPDEGCDYFSHLSHHQFIRFFQKLRRPLHQEFIVIIQQSSPKEKPPFIHKWGQGIKSY
jgi:hypothetical protein